MSVETHEPTSYPHDEWDPPQHWRLWKKVKKRDCVNGHRAVGGQWAPAAHVWGIWLVTALWPNLLGQKCWPLSIFVGFLQCCGILCGVLLRYQISQGLTPQNLGRKGLGPTTRAQQSVRFLSFIYSEIRIIASESRSNGLKSEETENTDSVYRSIL